MTPREWQFDTQKMQSALSTATGCGNNATDSDSRGGSEALHSKHCGGDNLVTQIVCFDLILSTRSRSRTYLEPVQLDKARRMPSHSTGFDGVATAGQPFCPRSYAASAAESFVAVTAILAILHVHRRDHQLQALPVVKASCSQTAFLSCLILDR